MSPGEHDIPAGPPWLTEAEKRDAELQAALDSTSDETHLWRDGDGKLEAVRTIADRLREAQALTESEYQGLRRAVLAVCRAVASVPPEALERLIATAESAVNVKPLTNSDGPAWRQLDTVEHQELPVFRAVRDFRYVLEDVRTEEQRS